MKKVLLSFFVLLMSLCFAIITHAQENFENPIVIGQLDGTYECGAVYTDANNTCLFEHDVPGTNDSPDVVYQFTLANAGKVNMNLCNSATNYDSYLYLFDETFSRITSDDDGCGTTRSKIERTLAAGTYYIVVEGWSTRCGNYHLEVSYNTPPIPSVENLPDLTGDCSIASAPAPEASSNCAGTITGTTETVFPVLSTTVITWTYDDGFGNIVTQTQNAIITDDTPPVPELASLPDIVEDCEITALSEPTATDNCGTVTVSHDAVLPINGSTTITWTYTDPNGNTSTQTQSAVINDATAPVPDLASLPDIEAVCEITELTAPTATDNCIGEIIGVHDASLPVTTQGTTVVSWTFTDGNGNSTTQTQNLIINDTTAPVPDLASLPDIEQECPVLILTVTATDNCAGTILGIPDVSFPITAQGTTQITWAYTDENGNTVTQTQNITINDVTAPTITCQADISVTADPGLCGALVAYELPIAADNCSLLGANLIANADASDGLNNWTITASGGNGWEAAQGAFKTSHGWCRKYQIVDLLSAGYDESALDLSPEIFISDDYQSDYNATDPYYLNVELRNASNEVIAAFYSGTIVTANDWQTISHTFKEYGEGLRYIYFEHGGIDIQGWGGYFGAKMTNATVKVENTPNINQTAGLATNSIFPVGTTTNTFEVVDAGGNTSTCSFDVVVADNEAPVPDLAILDDFVAECEVNALTAPTATDNCAGTILGVHDATLPITAQGTTVVTWTFTDDNGNSVTQTQNVVIDDITGPVAVLDVLADVTAECEVASLTAPTATDNCGDFVSVTNDAALPITTQGTTVVTWTYEDSNGNTATQTQNIVIDDITRPVADLDVLADVTAECEVASLTAPTATDNCAGTIIGTHDATFPITTQGTTVVTWTYEDNEGNTTTQTQNVVIDDITGPVADLDVLADVTAECEVTSLTAPTATDNCGDFVSVTNDAVLPITTQGTTVVTWTYEDSNGNTTTQSHNVVIDDITGPVADLPVLADVTAECEVASLTAPTATDNCGGFVSVTNDAALPITTQGTTLVTWTYEDSNGNTTTQTQNVVIEDITGPVADLSVLGDVTAECEVASLTAPTATDNCGGFVSVTNDAALPITTQGTTVVTWTYEDSNGNTTTQTQNVVIDDITGPVADVDVLADVTAECEVTSLIEPTATDDCGGLVTVTNDAVLPITTQGTTVVTWTYEDSNGNTTTQTQNVVIDDITAPVADIDVLAEVVECFELTSLIEPTATDNCGGLVKVSHDATLPITATTTVTWTYEDENGNSSTQTQFIVINTVDVSVTDNGPVLTANAEGATYQWVDCDNANAPIVGETGQIFTAIENGNYAVEVTQNNCTATSDCISVLSVGVDIAKNEFDISVYPNPTSNLLFIEFSKTADISWKLFSITGGVVLEGLNSGEKFSVDMKNLMSGVYLLNIQQNGRIHTTRVVRK